jgi:hypothetical protein
MEPQIAKVPRPREAFVTLFPHGSVLLTNQPTQGGDFMDLHLSDKVVLITGSSRGISLATAKAFAAEDRRLVLSARSPSALTEADANLRAGGARMRAQVADVTKHDQAAGPAASH